MDTQKSQNLRTGGPTPVAPGGSGAKAPPLAARPEGIVCVFFRVLSRFHNRHSRGNIITTWTYMQFAAFPETYWRGIFLFFESHVTRLRTFDYGFDLVYTMASSARRRKVSR